MSLQIQKNGQGVRLRLETDKKSAILIEEDGEERILLPIKNQASENTYYYEDTSGLAKTSYGYIGFYQGDPDKIKVLN